MSETTVSASGFHGLGIAPDLLGVLARLKFTEPTPIQRQSIPVAIEGKDLVGIAQTGTGKTLAFGIPLVQKLAQGSAKLGGRALIMLPTRELALQVGEVLERLGRPLQLTAAVLIGGANINTQFRALAKHPDIIIGTPGRLIDHLEQKRLILTHMQMVVLDEADRMLDMGFLPQIKKVLAKLPQERQTMLFSATMPTEIATVAATYMRLPVRVEVAPSGTTAERVTQELFIVPKEQKFNLLTKLLAEHRGTTLVFTLTKYGAKGVVRKLHASGIAAGELHANRSLGQRQEALAGFKSGKYRVLVATDIASRGIDVVGIELVLNFDLPSTSDDYVHRIGRTARAGAGGHAISFAVPDQQKEVRAIERMIKKTLPISKLPDLPAYIPRDPASPQSKMPRTRPARPHPSAQARHPRPYGPARPGNAPRRQSRNRPR